MQGSVVQSLKERAEADALILPFFEGEKPAFEARSVHKWISSPMDVGDFKGKEEETLLLYPTGGKEQRIVLVGLGKEKDLSAEVIRRSYAKALHLVKATSKHLNVQIPETKVLEKEEVEGAAIEGILLTSYVYKRDHSAKKPSPTRCDFIGGSASLYKRTKRVVEGVNFARDLVFGNADMVNPAHLAMVAKKLAESQPSLKASLLDQKAMEREGLDLLLAVSRGSAVPPALIILEYKGDPKSKERTALVGKGVTYDTGGLSLKPTAGMLTMREDMSGAAAVLGTIKAVSALKLPINIVGIIGATENAIGPKSYKIGDVYNSHAGVSVEVTNTDAEGRLVLADVLSYVQEKYKPKRVIDLATLTGGAVVALGEECSALMGNDERLSEELIEAGEKTYERLWPLPLFKEYRKTLKSEIADIKNSGARKASAIQGGIFLERFIKKCSWAHLDIAGTAFSEQKKPYNPIQATGVGVRLLTAYFEALCP
ncbi:MAG: Cytosol aminopeptidase [Chlamydiae bacterium]|nr:Cytosol aminopeptidase [Chlamydiota bacterium]